MSFEFGVRKWLTAHPLPIYGPICYCVPIVDFMPWRAIDAHCRCPTKGLVGLPRCQFRNGIVIEIGRKIRVPGAEEEGVPVLQTLGS